MPDNKRDLDQAERDQQAVIHRADRAQRILEDDLFKGAIQTIRDEAFNRFTEASPGDTPELTQARLWYGVTEDFINALAKHLSDGQMATDRLGDIKERKAKLDP
jgi:hypothetical protein